MLVQFIPFGESSFCSVMLKSFSAKLRLDVCVIPSLHLATEDLGQQTGIQLQTALNLTGRHGVEHANGSQGQGNVHLSHGLHGLALAKEQKCRSKQYSAIQVLHLELS